MTAISTAEAIFLDSQNLRIVLDIGDQGPDKPSAQIIFSLENYRVNMGIETQGDPCYGQVQTACTRRPRLFDSFDKTELWVVEMRGPPLRTGKSWELEEKFRQPWDEIYEAALENGAQMVICKAYNPRHELRREEMSEPAYTEINRLSLLLENSSSASFPPEEIQSWQTNEPRREKGL
ncbi:hypothetical protein DTO166G4_7775 [Paecilomyces variotii]|nr:hypothetical protein DTO166G4_7775 [Paecilomyces variotii]